MPKWRLTIAAVVLAGMLTLGYAASMLGGTARDPFQVQLEDWVAALTAATEDEQAALELSASGNSARAAELLQGSYEKLMKILNGSSDIHVRDGFPTGKNWSATRQLIVEAARLDRGAIRNYGVLHSDVQKALEDKQRAIKTLERALATKTDTTSTRPTSTTRTSSTGQTSTTTGTTGVTPKTGDSFIYEVTDSGKASGTVSGSAAGNVNVSWTIVFPVKVSCVFGGCISAEPPNAGAQLATSVSGNASEAIQGTISGSPTTCQFNIHLDVKTILLTWTGGQASGPGTFAIYPSVGHVNQAGGTAGARVPDPGSCSGFASTYYPTGGDLVGMQGPGCQAWAFVVKASDIGKQLFSAENRTPAPLIDSNCETMLGGTVTATAQRTISFRLVSSSHG